MISENEYHRLYDQIPTTVLEATGMPINYNLLTNTQSDLYCYIVDTAVNRYKKSYVDLLKSFQEDMDSLKCQTQEILDELE